MLKRSISLLLAMLVLLTAFSALSVSAEEADDAAAVGEDAEIIVTAESDPAEAPFSAETDAVTEGQLAIGEGFLNYRLDTAAGTAAIISAEKLSGDITLPDEIEGYPVTAVDDTALLGQDAVVSVTIPESVATIGAMAFGYCANGDKRGDFTIVSTEQSAAADYADENGFAFIDIHADKYPHITSFNNTEKGVKITWDAFEGADFYRVYYKNANGGWTRLASQTKREYVDTTVKGGETRTYTVRALKNKETFISDFSRRGWQATFIEAPVVTLSNSENGVMIKWNPCTGAEKYRVYYKNASGNWTRLSETTESSYLDTDVRSGNTYTYTVRCITPDSTGFTSGHNAGAKIRYVAAPRITSFDNAVGGVKIKWDAVNGADFYRIYYKNAKGGWTRLASQTKTEYTDTSVKSGETRVYTVRCLKEKETFVSDFVHEGWSNTFVAAPTVTLSNNENGVMIKWNACAGAEKYRVYYYGSKGWTRLYETSETSYVDADVSSGNTYTYTVRCITPDGKGFTSGHNAGKKIQYVAAPRISSFENLDNGIKIKWDAVKGADYYRIYYKNGSSWTRLASKYLTEYVDTSVKKGETRIYTIRCLKEKETFVSDFVHDGWSVTFHAPPEITSVSAVSGGNLVEWEPCDGVAAYRLYRKPVGGSWGRLFDSVTDTSYTDTSAESGTIYAYTLRYLDGDGSLISGYLNNVRYYLDGELADGTLESGGVSYYFNNGYLLRGLTRIGGKLYYYGSNGKLSKDTIVKDGSDYYYADKNGVCWESEDMRLAAEFIEKYCKGNTIKEKVKYGFMYLANNYSYQRVYNDMPQSEKDIKPFALELFKLKRGTCYRYAAGFACMAKIAGYRSRFCFGYSGVLQHGWTELYVDGRWLICDVDAQLPGYSFAPYEVYMRSSHVWILSKRWYSELVVKDGVSSWEKMVNF